MTFRAREFDHIQYIPGRKFKVIVEGCHLSGVKPAGPGVYVGWRRVLELGDILECAGYGAGWGSDPGHGIRFRDPEVGLADFYPQRGGAFDYRPMPGYLEPFDFGEEALV